MNLLDHPYPHHGGDLDEAERRFGRPAAGWIDLSTGVNPVPYPDWAVHGASLHRLPQPAGLDALLSAARGCYGVPDGVGIVAGPGSQALMQWLPALAPPGLVAVVGPTYAEHVRTWSDGGRRVIVVDDVSDGDGADVAVVVNPNNPDGRTVPPAVLAESARARAARGGLLVVDEAFADVNPETSVVPHLGDSPILVLRSFGKFFGLPGLRLGFAVGAPALVAGLKHRLGPWAVSGSAIEVGTRALADRAWVEATRIELRARRRRLDDVLGAAGLEIVGGTELFRLVHDDRAPKILEHLGRAGIFVRAFAEHRTWLRLGVPGSEADLGRLAKALSAAMSA